VTDTPPADSRACSPMHEAEFVDRSTAAAKKATASFFPC